MFSRQERLTEKRLFQLIFRQGVWVRGRSFSLRFVPALEGKGQIAFVISKKVSKAATRRNRMKRRLRAIFRGLLQTETYSSLLSNHYLLVIVHRSFDTASSADLRQEVESLLVGLQVKRKPHI